MNDCVHRPLICRMLYKLLTYKKKMFYKNNGKSSVGFYQNYVSPFGKI